MSSHNQHKGRRPSKEALERLAKNKQEEQQHIDEEMKAKAERHRQHQINRQRALQQPK
jgi:hypothetical protein